MALKTLGLRHVALNVFDVAACANFYQNIFNMTIDWQPDVDKTRLRWDRVVEQASADSEHGWRLAILEADIMLNELLDLEGYRGETMADKMKQVDRARFNTIDYAWEAHKIRNQVAHEGAAFPLSAREVRRVIGLYESVFREFDLLK